MAAHSVPRKIGFTGSIQAGLSVASYDTVDEAIRRVADVGGWLAPVQRPRSSAVRDGRFGCGIG
jgi:hypothetical protein